MQVDIRSPNFVVSRALRQHARRCLDFAFSRFSPQVDRVVVTLADINGPRGGLDKRCGIRVVGRNGWTIHVMHTEPTAEAAVSHAVARAGRTLARRLDRERGLRQASGSLSRILMAS